MVMTKRRQRATESTNSSAAEATAAAVMTDFVVPRIERCNAASPMLMKCDEPAFIAVDVYGEPAPIIRWHVGNRRVQKSSKYRATASGRRHTLAVLKVSEELEKGVWVMATNEAGEDSCLITIKTYKVLSGMRNSSFHEARNSSFHESILSVKESSLMLRRNETMRTARPFSPEPEVFPEQVEQELTSPEGLIKPAISLEDWQREMDVRNRMRSVDDLRYYSQWRHESMHGSVSGSTTGLMSTSHDPLPLHASADLGGSMSLNQSFMTDDGGGMELRQSIRRRRKIIRVRSRSASARSWCASGDSIASAPTARNPPSISFPPPPTTLPSPPKPPTASNTSFDPAPKPPIDRNGDLRRASTRRSVRSRRKKLTSSFSVEEPGNNTMADVEKCESAFDIQLLSGTDIDAIDGLSPEAFGETAAESSTMENCCPVTIETGEDIWELNGVPLNVLCHRILFDDVFDTTPDPVTNYTGHNAESEEFAAAEVEDAFSADEVVPLDAADTVVIKTNFDNIGEEQSACDLGSGRSSPAFTFPAPPTPPPRIDPPPLPTLPPPSELPTPESLLHPGLELRIDDETNRASLKRRGKKKTKKSSAVSAPEESTPVSATREEEVPAFAIAVNSTTEQSDEIPAGFTDNVLLVPAVIESEVVSEQPAFPAGDSYAAADNENGIQDFAISSEGKNRAELMLVPDLLSEIGTVPRYNAKLTGKFESEFHQMDFSVVTETDFAYEEDQTSATDERDNAVGVMIEAEPVQSLEVDESSDVEAENNADQQSSDNAFPSVLDEDSFKLNEMTPSALSADSKFANVDFIDDDENSPRELDARISEPEQPSVAAAAADAAALKVEDLISSAESQQVSASARIETNVVTWHEYGEMIKCVPDYDRDRATANSAGAAGMLDVQAILSQTVNLQKILETINSLTEGRLLQGWNGSQSTVNDDRNRSLSESANPLHADLINSNAVKSSRVEKHTRLIARKPEADPQSDDSVDFDAESYDCEMSPVAADLVESIHLATAEDDDDLDDLDSDPDEYDYDIGHLPKSAPTNCYSTAL